MTSGEAAITDHVNFLAKLIRPCLVRVLDFGAGDGALCAKLRDAGYRTAGIEPTEGARAYARDARGLIVFANPEEASLQAERYSLVTAIEVLEHVRDPRETLRSLYDLLLPGGQIYIATPSVKGALARLQRDRWREAKKPGHLFLFSRKALESVLHQAGFVDTRFIRFSPLGSRGPRALLHRALQAVGLYGGLRVVAAKA